MSSGADCHFTEVKPGQWKYQLQRWPYGDIEEYDTFGPFNSFATADDHLSDNHQNPGGYSVNIHSHHQHDAKLIEDGDEMVCPACWQVPK